jgi:hypothetical protein
MKYSYIINNIVVGYIDYTPKKSGFLFINGITIYRWYRGNNYSTIMFKKFTEDIDYNKIHLIAKEDMERYNSLYKLYESWGFIKIGKESIYSDNRGTFRRCLFELSIPNTA